MPNPKFKSGYARYDDEGNGIPYTIEEMDQYKAVREDGDVNIMIIRMEGPYNTGKHTMLRGIRKDGNHTQAELCTEGFNRRRNPETIKIRFDEREGLYLAA